MDVNQLREHPLQHELFDPPTEEEISNCAEHYRNVGGRKTIYACADGTILYGVRTVKASIEAGLLVLPTVVRDDLGNSDRPEVLLEMVRLYRSNQEMDSMTIGRCYKRLRDSLIGARQRLCCQDVTRIDIALAAPFSTKTLEQWGRLAELPRFVHPLIVNHKLSKKQAENLRLLAPEEKQAALAAIERGDSLKQVVNDYQLNCAKPPKLARKRQSEYPQQATSQTQS